MADVSNTKSNTIISGSSSADSINNWGDKVTINGLAGNDTIYNDAENVSIDAGAGNDSVINWSSLVTVNGGDGNNKIFNGGDTVTVLSGAGDDSIFNQGENVKIDTGAGNDSVTNLGYFVTISGGANNDNLINQGTNVLIDGGAGNNFFANSSDAESVTILGGTDADTIENYASKVSINSGAGSDSIQNLASKVTINMAGGNDFIKNFAESVSINGGDDSDSIGNWNGGNYVTIRGGNGNDSIYNNGASHVTINGDAGNDNITNWDENNSINGGAGNDSIENYNSKVKIDGGADNDYIYNEGSDSTINGGAGSDTIYNTAVIYRLDSGERQTVSADNVSINGGAGDDSIYNGGLNVKLGGGKNVSLNGGAGNDTLTGSANSEIFIYEDGNGFDVITNYSAEDTVKIASGTISSISVNDTDVIFNIGDGSLTLKNMQGRYITLTDSSGKTTTQIYGDTGYSAQDAIKNLVKSWNRTFLNSTSKLDESIKLSTQYNGIQDAVDHMIADCRAAGDSDTFLRKYCGIILDNTDTGAITGWDAGGVSIKTANSIVDETLPATKVPSYTDTWFTTSQGVDIHISSTGSSLNADGKKVFDGLYSWWADNSIKLIEDSYGISFSDKDSIDVKMVKTANYAGVTTRDSVKINQGNISFEDADDYNGNGKDRTIAHEFTHVAQNLYMGGEFPQFLMEGLADLTHGIDDWGGKTELMPSLAGNADSLSTYLDLNDFGTGSSYYYAAGFMFYRYLTRQASFSYDSLAANAWEDNVSIVGTSNAELLTGSGKNQTISAGAGNDTITSYGDKTKIIGGKGNDTIFNSGENVVFKYADGDGNDKITGFNDNSTLLIDGTFSTAKSGNNVIVTVGDGKISLMGAASLESVNIVPDNPKLLILDDSSPANITIGASVVTVDATARTTAIKITGNALNNSMKSGTSKDTLVGGDGDDYLNGNSGSDSLSGGNGNDKLYGGTGNDTLLGGNGNDSLNGYDGSDKLSGGTGNDTLLGGKGNDSLVGGLGNDKLSGGDGTDTLFGSSGDDSLNGGAGNDKLSGGDGRDTLLGGTGNDSLNGGAGNDKLSGGDGNDTLSSGDGKDTLLGGTDNDTFTGGNGADIFIYSTGNDVITDYAEGEDMISLGAAISKSSIKGSDATFTIGKNTLTVKNGFRKEIVIIDASGNERTIVGGSYLANDSSSAKSTLASWREVGDASERTTAIRLTGNALDNTILGGSGKDSLYGADGNDYLVGNAGADRLYGQNGNDTLWGGVGNDTLKGGTGADTFIYNSGEGKDVINGFEDTDLLQITGTFSASVNSAGSIIFKVDSTSGAITLKDFTATTFNVNGTKYHISGNKLVK